MLRLGTGRQLPDHHEKSCDPAISSTAEPRSDLVSRATGATPEARFFPYAAFCRVAKSLSHSEQMG
jgi:hypothetical protein